MFVLLSGKLWLHLTKKDFVVVAKEKQNNLAF